MQLLCGYLLPTATYSPRFAESFAEASMVFVRCIAHPPLMSIRRKWWFTCPSTYRRGRLIEYLVEATVWTPPPETGHRGDSEASAAKFERAFAQVCESENARQPFSKENPK